MKLLTLFAVHMRGILACGGRKPFPLVVMGNAVQVMVWRFQKLSGVSVLTVDPAGQLIDGLRLPVESAVNSLMAESGLGSIRLNGPGFNLHTIHDSCILRE